ncbi:hypothetical protein B0T14DRAFT_147628 [Immersiella caudata]|uniref:Secreted protein n=1 Tax=Immersiella caudata TaxID=314043 RepID=A0AA40C294_9PEZI|nr:hypothetical protein B0T14DRAFT_147628 [Immersiella caudata]
MSVGAVFPLLCFNLAQLLLPDGPNFRFGESSAFRYPNPCPFQRNIAPMTRRNLRIRRLPVESCRKCSVAPSAWRYQLDSGRRSNCHCSPAWQRVSADSPSRGNAGSSSGIGSRISVASSPVSFIGGLISVRPPT